MVAMEMWSGRLVGYCRCWLAMTCEDDLFSCFLHWQTAAMSEMEVLVSGQDGIGIHVHADKRQTGVSGLGRVSQDARTVRQKATTRVSATAGEHIQ